jgi:hypothetical protein
VFATELEGGGDGGAVVALSTFDFEDLFYQSPIATIEESVDSGALGFKTEAACALPYS